MRISLVIDGEVLRIEDEKYYILSEPIPDWLVMEETTLDKFKEEVKKYEWCKNHWDKKISSTYKEILNIIGG